MMQFANAVINNFPFSIFFIFLLISCEAEDDTSVSLDNLPVVTPEIQLQIEQAGEHYFSYLGYTSMVLEDGTVLLPDRELAAIFQISSDGSLINLAAGEGHGPGEIMDPMFISRGVNNSVLVYDRINKKVIRFNSNGKYKHEIMMPAWDKGQMTEIYELDEQHFLTIFQSFEYLGNMDLGPEAYVVVYNKDSEKYIHSFTMDDRLYARLIVNNQPRGGRMVPFSGENLRAFHRGSSGFYLFWSMENEIARISASLDTTETIKFELSKQQLSAEERNEIREDSRPEQWRTLQHVLPEYKAVADGFKTSHQNHFWLKLNHRSEFQQWLVLNQNGEKLAIVQLPKDAMLTHISEHHLGVRLDNHQFALFESVNL